MPQTPTIQYIYSLEKGVKWDGSSFIDIFICKHVKAIGMLSASMVIASDLSSDIHYIEHCYV